MPAQMSIKSIFSEHSVSLAQARNHVFLAWSPLSGHIEIHELIGGHKTS